MLLNEPKPGDLMKLQRTSTTTFGLQPNEDVILDDPIELYGYEDHLMIFLGRTQDDCYFQWYSINLGIYLYSQKREHLFNSYNGFISMLKVVC